MGPLYRYQRKGRDSVPHGEPGTRKHIPPKRRKFGKSIDCKSSKRLEEIFCSFWGGDVIQVVLKHTQVLGQQNTKSKQCWPFFFSDGSQLITSQFLSLSRKICHQKTGGSAWFLFLIGPGFKRGRESQKISNWTVRVLEVEILLMVQRPQTTTRDKLPTSTGAGFLSSTVLPGWAVFFWKKKTR